MNELNELDYKNQVINDIKKEFQNPKPRTERILKTLFDLRANRKSQKLSDSEFFDIVGETFNIDRDFFMKEIYNAFIMKIGSLIGTDKRQEMEKYIIEKYCLTKDEQILYECEAEVQKQSMGSFAATMVAGAAITSVRHGNVFLTNNRLIVGGLLKARGGGNRKDMRQEVIKSSSVFGYEFPSTNLQSLGFRHKKPFVAYSIGNRSSIIIKPLDKTSRREDVRKIFDLLRRDASEILELIKQQMASTGSKRVARWAIWMQFKSLRNTKELSDSDFLNIVKETFRLDPELFMSYFYPKMNSWNDPSFLAVKEQVLEFILKEGK